MNSPPVRQAVSTRGPDKTNWLDWLQRTAHPVLSQVRDLANKLSQVSSQAVTGSATLLPGTDLALVDATSSSVIITLPSPALWEKRITIVKVDSTGDTVTVVGTALVITLVRQWDAVEVISDGLTYYVVNGAFNLRGDVTGSPQNNIVSKLQGFTLTASGTNAPTTGQELQYDGTQWLPVSRNLRVLDNAYTPVGNWSFDIAPGSNVTDLSGNGCTLVTETGTMRTTTIHPTLGGVYFDGATDVWNASAQPQLQILSDLTILTLFMWTDIPAAATTLWSHGAAGETSDVNVLYQGYIDNLTQFNYISEHGAGVDDTANTLSTAGRFQPALLGITRDSGGSLKHWLNGIFAGSPFGTITLPTDGVNGRFRIGCTASGASFFKGIISSVAIYNKVLTAAQMLERYNYCLGGAYGLK